jgi:hypothetical protein
MKNILSQTIKGLLILFLIVEVTSLPLYCMHTNPLKHKVPFNLASALKQHPYAITSLCAGGMCGLGYYWYTIKELPKNQPIQLTTSKNSVINSFKNALKMTMQWINPITWYSYFNSQNRINLTELKDQQAEKWQHALLQIKKESLDVLYQWKGKNNRYLFLPKTFFDENKTVSNLKEVFVSHNIATDYFMADRTGKPWDDKKWKEAFFTLEKRSRGAGGIVDIAHKPLPIDDIDVLMHDARMIVKSFLIDYDVQWFEKNCIKKHYVLSRILTYTKLQQVMHDEKLSHIHLPLKVIFVKNKTTEKYLGYQESLLIVDKIINPTCLSSYNVDINISDVTKEYALVIFAEKKINHNVPFNAESSKELVQLIKKAPFDVGYDNILSDANGDAVIIDTEFKGEPADKSIKKLSSRYKLTRA